jgi:predicted N-acetyltransferase YhbS
MTEDRAGRQVVLRPGRTTDADACGRIMFEAFQTVAAEHNYPSDVPSQEVGVEILQMLLSHPGFFSVVAEIDGTIVGSNFLDERSGIAGLGPISVDPGAQNRQVGRRLMEAALTRVRDTGRPGVRLLQSAYHRRSLALYAMLGFQVREPIACLQGPRIGLEMPGHRVRPAREADIGACDRLCVSVHGHDRHGEVADAVTRGTARVVEHDGRITGYATDVAFFAHAVAETNRDLMALIGAAPAFGGPGMLVPMRNAAVFEWCLSRRLKVVQVMTLMTRGLYSEPSGAYLPSILY